MTKNVRKGLILAVMIAGAWYWNSLTPMQQLEVEIQMARINENVSQIGKIWVCSDLRWMAPDMCAKLDAELLIKYPRS